MVDKKWSEITPKPTADRGDRGLIIDSDAPNDSKVVLIEEFSRLQSAAKVYDPLIPSFENGDFVLFNGTLFYNNTAITSPEEFDPEKWTEVNGTNALVNVRVDSDLPDALVGAFTDVIDNGSNKVRLVFTVPPTYTDGQSIQITASTQVLYNGFHVLKKITDTTFDIVLLTKETGTGVTGTTTRTLAANSIYFIRAVIESELGYLSPDNSNHLIEGVGNFVNSITITGTSKTFFTAAALGAVTFRNVNIFSTGSGNTAFNVTGRTTPGPNRMPMNGGGVINFETLGTFQNTEFSPTSFAFFNFTNGFSMVDTPVNINRCSAQTSVANAVFLTLENIAVGLGGSIISNFVANMGVDTNVFDIIPTTTAENAVVIIGGSRTQGGEYFKVGTEKTAIIDEFLIETLQLKAGTTTNHEFLANQFVEIKGSKNQNGIFLIITVTSDTFNYTPIVLEAEDFTNTPKRPTCTIVRRITQITEPNSETGAIDSIVNGGFPKTQINATSIAALLENNDNVLITGTDSYDGVHVISDVIDSTSFTIPVEFKGANEVPSTWDKAGIQLTVEKHGLNVGDKININKTRDYDGGAIIAVTPSTDLIDIFTKGFFTDEITGFITDASLTGTDPKVLVDTISGELPSIGKGSVFVVGNSDPTVFANNDEYTNLVFAGIAPAIGAIEASDNELFKLTNTITGEVEYVGLEPFSGSLIVNLSVKSSSGGSALYTFRGLKNSGRMIDNVESAVTIGGTDTIIGTSFQIPVTAITGDKFRIQVKRASSTNSLIITEYTQVIQ